MRCPNQPSVPTAYGSCTRSKGCMRSSLRMTEDVAPGCGPSTRTRCLNRPATPCCRCTLCRARRMAGCPVTGLTMVSVLGFAPAEAARAARRRAHGPAARRQAPGAARIFVFLLEGGIQKDNPEIRFFSGKIRHVVLPIPKTFEPAQLILTKPESQEGWHGAPSRLGSPKMVHPSRPKTHAPRFPGFSPFLHVRIARAKAAGGAGGTLWRIGHPRWGVIPP